MDLPELVRAIVIGDLLTARQCVADAHSGRVRWDQIERPDALDDRDMAVAAGVVELLAARGGMNAPAWTAAVGPVREPIVLDPGLERMPRSFAYAKSNGPEPLRRRNLVALPDFLVVA